MQDTILIIDFGSQYTQLIARRIRELNVFSDIQPCNHPFADALAAAENSGERKVKGIILSGSPFSVHNRQSPRINISDIPSYLPVLGICYGAQLIAQYSGGKVARSSIREYGRAMLKDVNRESVLFSGMSSSSQVWMSHADTITQLPSGYRNIACTADVAVAAYEDPSGRIFGLQFHPEVIHTKEGSELLFNFTVKVCKCCQNWTPESFIQSTVTFLRDKLRNDKVLLAISGGVDSTVTAVLLNRAIGKNLHGIFVDNGLLRKNEYEDVLKRYRRMGLNVRGIEAKEIFYKKLQGVTDPEQKRKIIGKTFIEVFEKTAKKLKSCTWLAQGTIYPDRIESKSVRGPSATIKSHHNVGGLPEKMKMKIVEPLDLLFKDEVRKTGRALGIDDSFLERHPFPGPGLGVRILGDVTEGKVKLLQEADHIYIENLKKWNLYNEVWQAATILLPVRSVGVMGDERTYEQAVCLRAVTSTDGMTADWCHLPYEFLAFVSNEIINKVKGINRVVYDISSKPPSTIEWE